MTRAADRGCSHRSRSFRVAIAAGKSPPVDPSTNSQRRIVEASHMCLLDNEHSVEPSVQVNPVRHTGGDPVTPTYRSRTPPTWAVINSTYSEDAT